MLEPSHRPGVLAKEKYIYVKYLKCKKYFGNAVYFSHHPAALLAESCETGKVFKEWLHLFFCKLMRLRQEKKKKICKLS